MSNAEGHIVWNEHPKSQTPVDKIEVISVRDKTPYIVGASFVVFVPEQEFDETVVYEDGSPLLSPFSILISGFMVMLSDNSWNLLRRCLERGSNAMIQADTEKVYPKIRLCIFTGSGTKY